MSLASLALLDRRAWQSTALGSDVIGEELFLQVAPAVGDRLGLNAELLRELLCVELEEKPRSVPLAVVGSSAGLRVGRRGGTNGKINLPRGET